MNLSDKLELLVKSARGNLLPSCKTPSHLDSYKNYWIYLAYENLPNNGKCDCTLYLLLYIIYPGKKNPVVLPQALVYSVL